MTIRKATLQDKEQIIRLVTEFDEYFAKEQLFSPEILPFTQYKDKGSLFPLVVEEWLSNSKYFVFVAEENGELVGHIVGSIQGKKDRILDKEGSIDEWFVNKNYRHHGVGGQLYDVLLEVFKQNNCTHIGLKVYSANKETIEMYEKMGLVDLERTMVKKLT